MTRLTLRFILGVALLVVPLAAHADTLLFGYQGFDYESPDPNPATFGEAGSSYVGVGFVPFLFAPLVADTASNQYTYYISGLTPVSTQMFGTFLVVDYGTGSMSIYEDSKATGTPADYGANPPNGVTPSTFVDGTPYLLSTVNNFQFVFNTANGSGSYEGTLNFTGGSQIGNFPTNQRSGWQFAGSSGNALNVPPGYYHQIVGQAFLGEALATRHTTWGALKSLYRNGATTTSGGSR
jgi:hypothetical protein